MCYSLLVKAIQKDSDFTDKQSLSRKPANTFMFLKTRLTIIVKNVFILVLCAVLTGCIFGNNRPLLPAISGESLDLIAKDLLTEKNYAHTGEVFITAFENGAVFPPEIAAPVLTWQDATPDVRYWLASVKLDDHPDVYSLTNEPRWLPDPDEWEIIKNHSVGAPAFMTIIGFNNIDAPVTQSLGRIQFSTSTDRVDALILYRQVPLPFMAGEKNFRKIKWRLGNIASYQEPPVIMKDIPVCASCHQVTGAGTLISMEMNFRDDSGAHFIADVSPHIELSEPDFMTWSRFPKSEILPPTRGIFARVSPSGKYMVGTVNEISYAALTNDPAFCQLFFPTYGILAAYSFEKKEFNSLKGADDTAVVQTNPCWNPDESMIAFARCETKNAYHEDIANIKTHIEDCGIEELNRRFPIRFDIWTVPFNNGMGGVPQPLDGASQNGMSNYFPSYSPDGKWMVYTRSNSGIMLQPDSELYIIPSKGGTPRKLQCNRKLFNSWHSWSPNSRWLIFSSKENSIYTEIYITHIDETGNDSPPVRLSRFSDEDMAANLPEFVDLKTGQIKTMRLKN